MTLEERDKLNKEFLHKTVDIIVDRPIGFEHVKNSQTIVYPINYGYIKGVFGGDGEELDAYIIGENLPLNEFHGKVIAIIHRLNDEEDKLVVCAENKTFSKEEIESFVSFRESHYQTYIEL